MGIWAYPGLAVPTLARFWPLGGVGNQGGLPEGGVNTEHRFPCAAGETEGAYEELGPLFSPVTMAGSLSPGLFSVLILLSALAGLSMGGRAMPKLADRKLCADEECSRKSGEKELGCGFLTCTHVGVCWR